MFLTDRLLADYAPYKSGGCRGKFRPDHPKHKPHGPVDKTRESVGDPGGGWPTHLTSIRGVGQHKIINLSRIYVHTYYIEIRTIQSLDITK